MGVGYGSVAPLERAGLRRPSVMRAAIAVHRPAPLPARASP